MNSIKQCNMYDDNDDDDPIELFIDDIPEKIKKQATYFVIDCTQDNSRQLPYKLFSQQIKYEQSQPYETVQTSVQAFNDVQTETSLWKELCIGIGNYMRSQIILHHLNKVGVICFGRSHNIPLQDHISLKSSQSCNLFPGVISLLDVDYISAKRVKQIEALSLLTYSEFSKQYPENDIHTDGVIKAFKLSNLFWYLTHKLNSQSNPHEYYNKIYIITGNDSPICSTSELGVTIQRVRDLQEQFAAIECLPLQIPKCPPFNFMNFYASMLLKDSTTASFEDIQHVTLTLDTIAPILRQKQAIQRLHGHVYCHVWEGCLIAFKIYTSVLHQRTPFPFLIDSETHAPLQLQSRWICGRSGAILHPNNIRQFYSFQDKKIYMTKEDLAHLKYFPNDNNETFVYLLGFKPMIYFKTNYIFTHSYFLFPNDEEDSMGIHGSSTLVSGLITMLTKKNMFAVVRYRLSTKSFPRLGALLPQYEELDAQLKIQLHPGGFYLIPLPYSEDIRQLDLSLSQPTSIEGKQKRVKIVSDLIMEMRLNQQFRPQLIPNPAIQCHYSRLEALALDQEEPRDVPDLTNITYPETANIVKMIELWKAELSLIHNSAQESIPLIKNDIKPKNIGDNQVTESKIKLLHSTGSLQQLLVTQLKGYLASIGLPTSGTKNILIKRISDSIEKTTV